MKRIGKIGIVAAAMLTACSVTAVAAYSSGANKSSAEATAVPVKETAAEPSAKDETVYVLAGADGSVQKIIVSNWMKNSSGAQQLKDPSGLTDTENVKGDESYTMDEDNLRVWDAQGQDIYTSGTLDKELPVGLSVSYKLDGKSISAADLAGKSGRVTIRFDYENRQSRQVEIDGKKETVYVPFVMLTGVMLDNENFRNVEVTNGKVLNDGDRIAAVGLALPGLQESLGIDKKTLELPSYVEISADAENFTLGNTLTLATNELFKSVDTSKWDKLDDIKADIEKLDDGMKQLLDGSSKLYDGISTLLDKADVLTDSIIKLAAASDKLQGYTDALSAGAGTLNGKTEELSDGLSELSGNSEALRQGAAKTYAALLEQVQDGLTQAGLTVPDLTIDNYQAVLAGVKESLSDENVKALVKAGVREKVEAQTRETLLNNVLQGQGLNKEQYEALPAEQKSIIDGTVDTMMASSAVRQQVDANTEVAMQGTDAQAVLQQKLGAAHAGIAAINGSLEQLCGENGYDTFYKGVVKYTKGLDTAAAGAGLLADGSGELADNASAIASGMKEYNTNMQALKKAVAELPSGVNKLKDGAMQLSDGLKELNGEGIEKVISLVQDNLESVAIRLKATVEASQDYQSFSGISENTDGTVRFVYRTEEIK